MAVLSDWTFWLALLGGFLIGGIAGHWIGWQQSPRARTLAELKHLQDRFEEYRKDVTTHFSRTGELLAQMAESYRTVYQHLAEGAERLANGDRRALGLGENPLITHESATTAEPAEEPEPPSGEKLRL